jgi:hypothetical protein
MKLIEVARAQKDLLNEGIAFIAVWTQAHKNGNKIWFSQEFFPAEMASENHPIFSEEQLKRFEEILEIDASAVLLNGFYDSRLGSPKNPKNAADIADGIKWHYENRTLPISSYFPEEQCEADEIAAEESEEISESETVPTAADTITIEIPFTPSEDLAKSKENLKNLISGKATLIKKALGEDGTGEIPIKFTNTTVKFEWLRVGIDSEVIYAWSAFLAACVKTAEKGQRFNGNDTGLPENEKFTFRTFLVKIGMNDITNKCNRRTCLRFLRGDSAFATPESKQKWLAKHGSKAQKEAAHNGNSDTE